MEIEEFDFRKNDRKGLLELEGIKYLVSHIGILHPV